MRNVERKKSAGGGLLLSQFNLFYIHAYMQNRPKKIHDKKFQTKICIFKLFKTLSIIIKIKKQFGIPKWKRALFKHIRLFIYILYYLCISIEENEFIESFQILYTCELILQIAFFYKHGSKFNRYEYDANIIHFGTKLMLYM